MNEHHIHVRRTARFHTLGDPAAREVWIVCHGYAQLARFFLRSFSAIDDGSRYIVAPEALSRYYYETAPGVHARDARVAATWMTREDREHEIGDYIAYLDAVAEHVRAERADRVVVLGFSQGAATVSRWIARGRARVHDVVLWGSALPPELDPAPDLLRGARLTIAIGESDGQIQTGAIEEQERRMSGAGMDFRLVRYPGGHRIDAEALMQVVSVLG